MPDVNPIPNEFGSIVVQLIVPDVAAAVRFYAKAFCADEMFRNQWPDDKRVFHCELLIGGGRIMLHDEFPERGLKSPQSFGGTPVTVHLYVPDADATFASAVSAGAKSLASVGVHFWGVRSGVLEDPFGHRWIIATRVEDLGPEEIVARAKGVPPNERLPIGKTGLQR